jgi:hypothetical protein
MFSQNLFNLFLVILYFNQSFFSEYSGMFRFMVLYFPFCADFWNQKKGNSDSDSYSNELESELESIESLN